MDRCFLNGLCLAAAALGFSSVHAEPPVRLEHDQSTGAAAAVVVDDLPLVHTAQLLPVDEAGKVVAASDAAGQVERLLSQLVTVLAAAESGTEHLVKLNLYVAREQDAARVWKALAAKFSSQVGPAMSLVVTPLPHAEALVGLDAVAVAAQAAGRTINRVESATVLPAGARLYVSGQAEKGDLRAATRKTLESLSATLKHCGRTDQDIVQLKCFLKPMQSVAEVEEEISHYFGRQKPPPTVFVEWRLPSPIEIELIAWGGPARPDAAEALEFVTPPGMTASPVFSRVARIHRGGTIYFSDVRGPAMATADEQLASAFDRLGRLLEKAGSDWRHLAKATYYVTDDEVSKDHNAIRLKFFDPERPPAASKAMVTATGRLGVGYVMDMIAVPTK